MRVQDIISENPLVARAAKLLPTMPQTVPNMTHAFRTARGSTYAFNANTLQSIRNRSGAAHASTSTGIQPISEKTVFMDLSAKEANDLASIFQMGNRFQIQPISGNRVQVVYAQDYGPRRAGEVYWTSSKPFTTQPQVGLSPIEIFDRGQYVHVGNPIIELITK